MIFHKSLATGEVPGDWRTAYITPVFKKGQKYQADNYRRISLTSVCFKIMEHVIASHIMNHGRRTTAYTHYSMASEGADPDRSCETQLIEFIDDLSNNLPNNQQTDVLVMDFAKAFDKVCHSLLTHKLHQYGMQGNGNRWFKNLLAKCSRGRTITVCKCRIKSPSRLCAWTMSLPLLHTCN